VSVTICARFFSHYLWFRESQAQVSPLVLHSSSALGSGKLETNATKLAKNEDKNVRHALEHSIDGRRRKRRKIGSNHAFSILPAEDSLSNSSDEDEINESNVNAKSISHSEAELSSVQHPRTSPHSPSIHEPEFGVSNACVPQPAEYSKYSPALGGALGRNPDGTVVSPRVVFRKRKKEFDQKVRILSCTSYDTPDTLL
jgi:ATP-dependent RNA helicase DHX37/DHR1